MKRQTNCGLLYNRWEDYKEEETNRQVRWLVNRKHISTSKIEQLDQSNCVVFTQANETDENCTNNNIEESNDVKSDDIIDLFFSTCKPIRLNPPQNINDAIVYYHSRGFHMIPKVRGEKRPAIKWKIYQKSILSTGKIDQLV